MLLSRPKATFLGLKYAFCFSFIYADFEIASLRASEKSQAYHGMFPVLLEMDSSIQRKRISPQKLYDILSTKFVSLPTTLLFTDVKINCWLCFAYNWGNK